jgi:VanZ family protein
MLQAHGGGDASPCKIVRLVRHQTAAWACLVAYAGLIFYLSSQSLGPELSQLPPGGDKVLHLIEYGFFGLLTYHALNTGGGISNTGHRRRFYLWLAILIACAYGVSDEIHQSFVPTRDADPFDVAADTVGAAVGAWCLFRFDRYQRLFNRPEAHQSPQSIDK